METIKKQKLSKNRTNFQEPVTKDEIDIDFKEFFFRCVASWKLFVIFVIIGAGLAFGITHFLIRPKYEASSTIYLVNSKGQSVAVSDLQIGAALASDYLKIFDLWDIHHSVAENLNLNYSESALKGMLTVRNETGTRLLELRVRSTNPSEAAVIANEYAEVASKFIVERMATDEPHIISYAHVPTTPVSPNNMRNTIIGAAAGFVLVFAYVFIRMLVDDKIRTAEDVRKYTGLVNLAIIPKDNSEESEGKRR